jgi:O-antigen/teichoic acid export membrane protein
VRLSLPLGIVMALISLDANLPFYVLKSTRGNVSVGVFGAVAYVLLALTVLVSSIGQSLAPRLARAYARDDRSTFVALLRRFAVSAAVAGAVLVILTASFGHVALRWVYGSSFATSGHVLIVLALGTATSLVASSLGFGMTSSRCFAIQAPLFGGATLATLCSALLLVPSHGLSGAAWSTVAGATFELVLSFVVVCWAVRHQTERVGQWLGVSE